MQTTAAIKPYEQMDVRELEASIEGLMASRAQLKADMDRVTTAYSEQGQRLYKAQEILSQRMSRLGIEAKPTASTVKNNTAGVGA